MRFGNRFSVLRLLLVLLLGLALFGVVTQECAPLKPGCMADCCLPTPYCLSLNFSQAAAPAPDAPSTAPVATFVLLAILSFLVIPLRFSAPAGFAFAPVRSDPGGWRAPSRAQLRCWTV